MVILQFNKLIRNKWVWGAFAVVISAAFCFDDLFTTREREERVEGGAGLLAGKSVKAAEFSAIAEEIRGLGRNRDWRRKTGEVNLLAWETLAELDTAEKNGIVATDEEVRQQILNDRGFQANGAFSFALYQRLLRENSITPERYEAFLKRRLTSLRLSEAVLASATWVSPMEFDRAVADVTDTYTVRVASFKDDPAEAAKVKVDDAALKKWYEANTNSIALPERVKLRMVKYDATDAKVLAKMSVTEDEMRDQYDATIEKYTSTDTNGVESVKKFEEVKAEIERELRQIAAVQYFETNLNRRAYAVKAAKGASRLDEIAKEDGLEVVTSDWFSPEGGYVDGFMKMAYEVAPGATDFTEKVAELDSESEDLRYGVVLSDKAVWLVEKAATSPAHVPTFEEAKTAIQPRALADAKAEAFKARVMAIAAKGTNAVLTTANVSTNYVFAICDMKRGEFPEQQAVAHAARKLGAGEVSEFERTGEGSAILVVCLDRQSADAAKAANLSRQFKYELSMLRRRQLPEAWRKWNLERLGYDPTDLSSIEESVDEE